MGSVLCDFGQELNHSMAGMVNSTWYLPTSSLVEPYSILEIIYLNNVIEPNNSK